MNSVSPPSRHTPTRDTPTRSPCILRSYPISASDVEVSSIESQLTAISTNTLTAAGVSVTTAPEVEPLQIATTVVLAPSPPPPSPPPPSPPPSPPLSGLSCVDAATFGSSDPAEASNFSIIIPTTEYLYGPALSAYNSSVYCPDTQFAPRGPYAFWLRIETVREGPLTLSTCDASSTVDTNIAVFRGSSCAQLEPIACNGDGEKNRDACQWGYSQVTLSPELAVRGESYFVVVTSASYHGVEPPQDPPPQNAVRVSATYGVTPPPSPPPPSPPPSPPPITPPPPSLPPLIPCQPVQLETTTVLYADQVSWEVDPHGAQPTVYSAPVPFANNQVYSQDACISPGPHELLLLDGYGAGWPLGTELRVLQGPLVIAGPFTLGTDGATGNGRNRTLTFVSEPGSPRPPPVPPNAPPSAPKPTSPSAPPPSSPPPSAPPNAPGVTTVTSVTALRSAIAAGGTTVSGSNSNQTAGAQPAVAQARLQLPPRTLLQLGGVPIQVAEVSVIITGDCGDNATYPVIDAESLSRAFDVANGTLTLTCVRVINGQIAGRGAFGGDARGGCVRAQVQASLVFTNVFFSACSSLNPFAVSAFAAPAPPTVHALASLASRRTRHSHHLRVQLHPCVHVAGYVGRRHHSLGCQQR